jgi:hypothetical protein
MKTTLIATLATVLATTAFAQVTNPNFDVGLSGWTFVGDAAVRDGAAYLTTATSTLPGDDGGSVFNFSGNDTVDSFTLEGFAGLTQGALDPDRGNTIFAHEGSAIKQTFNVVVGDFVGFSWQLFTNEASGNDYAFVVLNGVLMTLGTSAGASPAGTYGFDEKTGVGNFSSTVFTSNQTITLTIGVVDAGFDGSVTSALRIDTVTVPEPRNYALLGIAAAFGVHLLVRRRSRLS